MARMSAGDVLPGTSSARIDAGVLARDLALPLVLGIAAVAIGQRVKVPVQLPGHEGAIWMAAVVGARLVSRSRGAGSIAGLGALLMSVGPSADLGQGIGILVAGALLDGTAWIRAHTGIFLWAFVGGAVGNAAVLVTKLIAGDVPRAILRQGIGFGLETYLAFGALGGAIAGIVALAVLRARGSGKREAA
jgi:hypothetical protein